MNTETKIKEEIETINVLFKGFDNPRFKTLVSNVIGDPIVKPEMLIELNKLANSVPEGYEKLMMTQCLVKLARIGHLLVAAKLSQIKDWYDIDMDYFEVADVLKALVEQQIVLPVNILEQEGRTSNVMDETNFHVFQKNIEKVKQVYCFAGSLPIEIPGGTVIFKGNDDIVYVQLGGHAFKLLKPSKHEVRFS